MPLQKLAFKPGTNRENTNYSNEGGWWQTNKVRFRSGQPEKIGGWTKDTGVLSDVIGGTTVDILYPSTGTLWGIVRSLWNWVTLNGYNLLSLGTNQKFYIQNGNGGYYYDITPLTGDPPGASVVASNAFTTTASSSGSNRYVTVTCNLAGYNGQTGDFVTISAVSGAINGIPAANLEGEFQITYVTGTTFTVQVYVSSAVTVTAGTTGGATFALQISTGGATYTVGVGWGAGIWSSYLGGPGWGQAVTVTSLGIGIQMRLWSQSNYGQNLVFNPRGGPIYYWVVDTTPTIFNRAQIISTLNTNTQNSTQYWKADASCPSVCNYVLVSDSSRFLIAFGANDPTGTYGTTTLDPMLIRWSNQEDLLTWIPLATNQAGDYRLSHGSSIITAQQTRQEILVFTDSALYSMQYLGPPYVWSFQILGDNISIAGPNAVATASNITFWMGLDKFYMYSGRVETLPSTLREYVYTDINIAQAFQFVAGTNEGYNEVWWQYCSISGPNGTGTQANPNIVIDRYVIYNYVDNVWYYGDWANYEKPPQFQGRTAWLDSSLRQFPMAATYGTAGGTSNGLLVYHESGVDDGTVNPPVPIVANVQSSDFDIGDGNNFGFVWRLIPDLTFDGSNVNNPTVYFTALPRTFPGAPYGSANNPAVESTQDYQQQITYNVQYFTQQVYVRIRGRQMAFKVSSGTQGSSTDGKGVQWQLGAPRIDIRPDGRR
jgi:hypothetical protein